MCLIQCCVYGEHRRTKLETGKPHEPRAGTGEDEGKAPENGQKKSTPARAE